MQTKFSERIQRSYGPFVDALRLTLVVHEKKPLERLLFENAHVTVEFVEERNEIGSYVRAKVAPQYELVLGWLVAFLRNDPKRVPENDAETAEAVGQLSPAILAFFQGATAEDIHNLDTWQQKSSELRIKEAAEKMRREREARPWWKLW